MLLTVDSFPHLPIYPSTPQPETCNLKPETCFYYAHDHLFSAVALIDDQGNVIERYEYNAYGMPTIYNAGFTQTYDSSQYDNPYIFTGRRVDSFDSGSLRLQYNRNRYYDYYTGRWLSHDTFAITTILNDFSIFEPAKQYSDSVNLYQYARSQPTKLLDPKGFWGSAVHYGETKKLAISSEHWMYYWAADIVGRADLNVDPFVLFWPFHTTSKNLSWHFDIPHDATLSWGSSDSRYVHAEEELLKAINKFWKKEITDKDISEALEHLGTALHPVQDWVTHGTWDPTWNNWFNWRGHPKGSDSWDEDFDSEVDGILRDYERDGIDKKGNFDEGTIRQKRTQEMTLEYLNKFKRTIPKHGKCYCRIYIW